MFIFPLDEASSVPLPFFPLFLFSFTMHFLSIPFLLFFFFPPLPSYSFTLCFVSKPFLLFFFLFSFSFVFLLCIFFNTILRYVFYSFCLFVFFFADVTYSNYYIYFFYCYYRYYSFLFISVRFQNVPAYVRSPAFISERPKFIHHPKSSFPISSKFDYFTEGGRTFLSISFLPSGPPPRLAHLHIWDDIGPTLLFFQMVLVGPDDLVSVNSRPTISATQERQLVRPLEKVADKRREVFEYTVSYVEWRSLTQGKARYISVCLMSFYCVV